MPTEANEQPGVKTLTGPVLAMLMLMGLLPQRTPPLLNNSQGVASWRHTQLVAYSQFLFSFRSGLDPLTNTLVNAW